ncbi:MAG: adenylate/guanylate cyclase domain-containing protein, partial [Leptospiraceae bacterium]|nr:adenylate/guanylate cyclase domain-containing protein [Leptospiraceae bacterium]
YYRRNNSAPFHFAILSIFIMIFSAIVGDRFLYKLFPNIWSWEINYKLEFAVVPIIVWSITLFLDNLFPDKNKIYIYYSRFIKTYCIFIFLFILAFPASIFTEYYIVLISLMAFSIIGIIITIFLAIKRRNEGAFEFLFGFLILIVCTIHDIMVSYSLFNAPLLIKFGLTGMILSQAILLAKIFTGDFKRAETLTISLKEINSAYSKFVPTEFLNLLEKKSILDIKLGTHSQKEMSILFVDIRSFTTISESMTPKENFEFLNSYLKRITPIINKNNGFIDKFIGDAIMALFPGKVDDAVHASIEIHNAIREYNKHRSKSGYKPISVGVGIHTGNLILGTIGHDDRMEGTVISDAVNLASRIESLTKYYKTKILVSEDTFNELENSDIYKYRILDTVRVKGKMKSISIIEILDGYEEEKLKLFLSTKTEFDNGIILYKKQKFKESIPYFEKVLELNEFDYATKLYLERAKYYNENGLPLDWEGIEDIEMK